MTSESQRKRGYLLPDTVTGHPTMPVCLCIPDEENFRAAFLGAVYELGKPWNWAATSESDYLKQREAALLWKTLLEEHLHMPCNICELVAACLQTIVDTPYDELSDALKDIYGLLKEIEKKNGTPTTPTVYQDNPAYIDEGMGCDYDNLFAAMVGLVDIANTAIKDVLQDIDAATGVLEAASEVVSAIPIFGLLPFDEMLDFAETVLDGLYTNYLAAYSEPLRQEYACDLFCMAKDDCSLFFVQAFGYFAGKASLSISTADLEDVIEFITQGVFSGEEYVHVVHALFFFVLAFGGDWGKYDNAFLINWVRSKFNDSDPDWAILCDCTIQPYTVRYDFAPGDTKTWNILHGQQYSSGRVGSLPFEDPEGQHLIVARSFQGFDGLEQFQYPNIQMDFVGQSNPHLHVIITHSGGQEQFDFPYEGAGAADRYFDPPLNNVTYIEAEAREDYAGDGGFVSISGVVLVGESNDPPPEP